MKLSERNKERLATFLKTVRENPYIPQEPTTKQAAFLMAHDILEGFFGGSAGPGKSSGLLMAAMQYVTEPKYAALLLRRTYKDLALPGALMDRAHGWLQGTDAKWNDQEKTWFFPSGATLTFGYLENENDKYRYQGAEFNFIAFDELTQFSETQYQYLFSRLRRLEGSETPIRMRSASNPGNLGHEWVKSRFILGKSKDRYFIPALLRDNPHIDSVAYENALNLLDPVTREQLRNGNWDISLTGGLFEREWFEIVPGVPRPGKQVRFWDLAATEQKSGNDPDYTAGVLLAESEGVYYVKDVIRARKNPGDVETIIQQTANIDGIGTEIFIEQEPGSSGVNTIDHYARNILRGFSFRGERSTGSKIERAKPASAAAYNHNIKICAGAWNSEFLNELVAFPKGVHDDQVDGFSGAFMKISNRTDTSRFLNHSVSNRSW